MRKPNGDAIAEMALDNFVEMRDRVGGDRFLLMKAVENLIENRLPHKFRSRYAMVCYGGLGNVSYDVALRLGAGADLGIERDPVTNAVTGAKAVAMTYLLAEFPDGWTWAGGAIIFAATAFIAWRERAVAMAGVEAEQKRIQ